MWILAVVVFGEDECCVMVKNITYIGVVKVILVYTEEITFS